MIYHENSEFLQREFNTTENDLRRITKIANVKIAFCWQKGFDVNS